MNTEQTSVDDVIKDFEACWNRHDMEAFSQLFTENADFVNVIGLVSNGRTEIKNAHEAIHATIFRHSRLNINNSTSRFIEPNAAVVRSRWDLTGISDSQGAELPPKKGMLINILVKRNDGWLITAAQNTEIVSVN